MNSKEQQIFPRNEEKAVYEKPTIEIIEMEHEGSILQGSGDDLNPGGGSPWS